MKLNIVGLGRLGKALAKSVIASGLAEIGTIYSRRTTQVADFLCEMGQGQLCEHLCDMPHAEITMITTPDDHIQDVAAAISMRRDIQSSDIFFHCSGRLSSEILHPIREKGGRIASVHPLKSFSSASGEVDCSGTYCGIEGEQHAISILEHFFKAMGFIPFRIDPNKKVLYHAGAVFASNYLVTLAHEAAGCMVSSGVCPETAKKITLSLMRSSLVNLEQKEAKDALTGPLVRGDIQTISAHLASLGSSSSLYQTLAKATLPLTQHEEETLRKLEKILE